MKKSGSTSMSKPRAGAAAASRVIETQVDAALLLWVQEVTNTTYATFDNTKEHQVILLVPLFLMMGVGRQAVGHKQEQQI
jgi:hypothetical protein